MAQTIQIKRRLGGAAGAPATLDPGEPAFNDNGITLHIGGSTAASPHLLIGATRQVEIAGAQTITGVKTIDVDDLKITGGTAGAVLTTDGTG